MDEVEVDGMAAWLWRWRNAAFGEAMTRKKQDQKSAKFAPDFLTKFPSSLKTLGAVKCLPKLDLVGNKCLEVNVSAIILSVLSGVWCKTKTPSVLSQDAVVSGEEQLLCCASFCLICAYFGVYIFLLAANCMIAELVPPGV